MIDAVVTANEGERRVASLDLASARAADAVRRALEAKIEEGLVDQSVAYLSPRSTLPHEQVIDRLRDAVARQTPPSRSADATFYEGGRTAGFGVPDGAALHQGRTYELEIAVRAMRTGIPSTEPSLGAEYPARAAKVLVVVEAAGGLTVDEPIAHLTLPTQGDSTDNAWFRIHAVQSTPVPSVLAEMRVRLFYELNLLESVIISAEIVSPFRENVRSILGLEHPISLRPDRMERSYDDLDGEQPCAVHIDVARTEAAYRFHFTIQPSGGPSVILPAPSELDAAAVADLYDQVRVALLAIVVGDYANVLSPSDATFTRALRSLATVGRNIYACLFRHSLTGALAEVADALEAAAIPTGAVIQVSVHPSAADFNFPWAFIFDGEIPTVSYTAPDTANFWGLKYCIEQHLPKVPVRGFEQDAPASDHPNLAIMLWEQFSGAMDHMERVEEVARSASPPVDVTAKVTSSTAARTLLQSDERKDILYFYSHAHTRVPVSEGRAADSRFRAIIEALSDAGLRTSLLSAYEQMTKSPTDSSWIMLSHGKLELLDLYATIFDLVCGNPIVILNACESAAVTPTLSGESFTHFFLDRGARAFVGTECLMTTAFAPWFGSELIRRLAAGLSVGAALRAARLRFIAERNPLGLAYTLYGSGAARASWPVATRHAEEPPTPNQSGGNP